MVKLSILQRCLMTSRGSFSSLTQRDLNSPNHFVDIYGSQWSNNNNNDINHNLSGNPAVCRASTGGWAKLYWFFCFWRWGFFSNIKLYWSRTETILREISDAVLLFLSQSYSFPLWLKVVVIVFSVTAVTTREVFCLKWFHLHVFLLQNDSCLLVSINRLFESNAREKKTEK